MTAPETETPAKLQTKNLGVYVGPRLEPSGFGWLGFPASTALGGQRNCSSWLVTLASGDLLLVNAATFTPKEYRWGLGYRWGDLNVVSVHRLTERGLGMLMALEYAPANLKIYRGVECMLWQAVRMASPNYIAGYELTDFVRMEGFRGEFPEEPDGSDDWKAAVAAVFGEIHLLGGYAIPETARIHRAGETDQEN